MSVEIKPIEDRKIWNVFLEDNPTHSFLQSWNWADFNASMGHKVFRLGIYEESFRAGVCLVLKIEARRGSFLFVPHGPILNNFKLETLISYLKALAEKERCSFIRISPILEKTPATEDLFRKLGFRKAPIHMHAELLWLLDISRSEEEILKGMRKTTRYSINRAAADGVTIEKSIDPSDLVKFNKLYEATATRQHFVPFSPDYIKKEFSAFSPDTISIFFAKYQGEVVSSAIIVYENHEAFYHHGASSQKFQKVTPTHLLQWEIIRDAKARGCKFYNFWGIAPDNRPKHPMAGLSLFKKGFGGFLEELMPAQDLIISPKYWLNFLVEKIRKIRRRL